MILWRNNSGVTVDPGIPTVGFFSSSSPTTRSFTPSQGFSMKALASSHAFEKDFSAATMIAPILTVASRNSGTGPDEILSISARTASLTSPN